MYLGHHCRSSMIRQAVQDECVENLNRSMIYYLLSEKCRQSLHVLIAHQKNQLQIKQESVSTLLSAQCLKAEVCGDLK